MKGSVGRCVLGAALLSCVALACGTAQQRPLDQGMRRTSGEQWFVGAFEVSCEAVGVEGVQVLQVYGVARNDRDALLEARRNAVRALLFRGVSTRVCTVPPLLRPAQLTSEADEYFARFFARGGLYLSYVEFAGDEVESRVTIGRDVKIGTTVVVNRRRLLQDLEQAGIIRTLGSEFVSP
jgi:hypothetical protein